VRNQSTNPFKLYNNFNHIRVRSFILNGAPNCHSERNYEPAPRGMRSVVAGFWYRVQNRHAV
jgi:hypothetical protein